MSRISPNIRQSDCGGNTNIKYLGGCTNQFNSAISNIQVLRNTTKVRGYIDTSSWVDPYARPEQDTAPDCSPYFSLDYDCGDGINGNPLCGIPSSADVYTCSINSFDVCKYNNCFEYTNETKSYTGCAVVGCKRVYGKKYWHGKLPYTSRNYNQTDYTSWCCTCGRHYQDTSPETVKYLKLSANSSREFITNTYSCSNDLVGTFDCSGTPVDDYCTTCTLTNTDTKTGAASNTTHVDNYGNLIVDTCTSSSNGYATQEDNLANANELFELLELANGNVNDIISFYCDKLDEILTATAREPDVMSGDGTTWDLQWTELYECYDGCGNLVSSTNETSLRLVLDLNNNTVDYYSYGPQEPREKCTSDGDCYTWVNTEHIHYSFTSTTYTYEKDITGAGSVSFDQTFHEEVNGSLSSPYTVDQVYDDLINLMSYYPLDDDVLLPWRTESDLLGPLVSYDEIGGTPIVGTCEDSILYTGKICGKPAPKGIDKVWNPGHYNYNACDSTVTPGCWSKYVETYGQYSDYVGIPHATQWLNKWQESQMPQGAFIGWNFFYTTPGSCGGSPTVIADDCMWSAKYAEIIIEPRKSYNYARPCGIDRYQISESAERCIVNIIGNTVDIETSGNAIDISTGSYVWVCGTNTHDGLWKADKITDYQIELTQLVISESLLNSKPIDNCGTGIIAKLKYQSLQPGICGRVDITNATNTTPITCSLMEPAYLSTDDYVFVNDCVGNTAANGYHKIIVLDPSNIVLSGSSGNGDYIANSGYMYCPFSIDYKWNDTTSKNEYTTIEWKMDYRDRGEFDRITANNVALSGQYECDMVTVCTEQSLPTNPRVYQSSCSLDVNVEDMTVETHCIKRNPCAPSIAYWSPNNETFGNSISAKKHTWPTVKWDNLYGGIMWNAIVKQTDDDYMWQAPPCPCDYDGIEDDYTCTISWLQDDGTCNEDGLGYSYYKYPPQVEARAELPLGAPPLPVGKYLSCLTPDQFTSINCPNGNVCNPPAHNANNDYTNFIPIISYPPYYILYLKMLQCICESDRFASDYSTENNITCIDILVPAP